MNHAELADLKEELARSLDEFAPGANVLSAKDEAYAQLLANKAPQNAATYRKAGFKGGDANARRKAQSKIIRTRVREILQHRITIVDRATNRVANQVVATKQWVLDRLVDNVERSMQLKPVRDRQGRAVGEFQYDGATANAALKLLGLEAGMFVQRTQGLNVNWHIHDKPMTDDEWAAAHTAPEPDLKP